VCVGHRPQWRRDARWFGVVVAKLPSVFYYRLKGRMKRRRVSLGAAGGSSRKRRRVETTAEVEDESLVNASSNHRIIQQREQMWQQMAADLAQRMEIYRDSAAPACLKN